MGRYTFIPCLREMYMYKYLFVAIVLLLISCDTDDNLRRNPNLVDIGFVFDLNLNLPQYSSLGFPGNYVVVNNQGLRGFVVYTPGNNQYVAYELSDPNHTPNACSRMTISGITATCPCPDDNHAYNILTGQPTSGDLPYGMKPYRVERQGNIIRVSN